MKAFVTKWLRVEGRDDADGHFGVLHQGGGKRKALKGRQYVKRGFQSSLVESYYNPRSICLKRPPLVILNASLIQERPVFVFPVSAMMVFRLVSDIVCGLIQVPVIDRECAIAPLPGEAFVILLVQRLDPLAAISLDVLNEFGDGDGFGQVSQNVDVVADAADGNGDASHVVDNASDVGEDFRQVFIAYLHAVAIDVEHDVDVDFYE